MYANGPFWSLDETTFNDLLGSNLLAENIAEIGLKT